LRIVGATVVASFFTFGYPSNLKAGGAIETREGWPLLNVEIEVNGDLKSTKIIVRPWLLYSDQYKIFFSSP
jgi:hypothetical protein